MRFLLITILIAFLAPSHGLSGLINGDFSCAWESGYLKCWGRNSQGQLGQGDTTNRGDTVGEMGADLDLIDLGTGLYATAFDMGFQHACALLGSSPSSSPTSLKCWGSGSSGQLGLGSGLNEGDTSGEMGDNLAAVNVGSSRSATDIFLGYTHTCAILSSSESTCWGSGSSGELGTGSTSSVGTSASSMGDYLTVLSLGSGLSVMELNLGYQTSCALLTTTSDDYSLKCWGYNQYGQLGYGDTNNRGDGAGEMGDNLPAIDLGSGFTLPSSLHADMNFYHMCAITDAYAMKCWGRNDYAQLGLGDMQNRGDENGEMGDYLPFVNVGTGRTVVDVCGGSRHTCVVLDSYEVKCWGDNTYGQLGYGDTVSRGNASDEMGDYLSAVDLGTGLSAESIHCGNLHTCVSLSDDSMKCWGRGSYGQLGYESTNNVGDGLGEMGDYLSAIDLGFPSNDDDGAVSFLPSPLLTLALLLMVAMMM